VLPIYLQGVLQVRFSGYLLAAISVLFAWVVSDGLAAGAAHLPACCRYDLFVATVSPSACAVRCSAPSEAIGNVSRAAGAGGQVPCLSLHSATCTT